MVATKTELNQYHDDRLVEWSGVDNDAATPHISVPTRSEVTIQLMEIEAGAPTIGVQITLARDEDTKVWGAATLTDASTAVALTTAGAVATVLQSGVLIRPLRTAGTGTARVRIKATRVR